MKFSIALLTPPLLASAARPYVLDVKYEKAFETDVHVRVQKAFAAHHIAPPAILHRTLPN